MRSFFITIGLMAMSVVALPLATRISSPTTCTDLPLVDDIIKCQQEHATLPRPEPEVVRPPIHAPIQDSQVDTAGVAQEKQRRDGENCNGIIAVDVGQCLPLGDAESAYQSQVLINNALHAVGNKGFQPVPPGSEDR